MNLFKVTSTESPLNPRGHYPRVFCRVGGAFVCGLHSLTVVGFALIVNDSLKHSPEGATLWFLWLVVDFPVSLGLGAFLDLVESTELADGMTFKTVHTFLYASYFLVLGGLQYYLIAGWLIGAIKWRGELKAFKE